MPAGNGQNPADLPCSNAGCPVTVLTGCGHGHRERARLGSKAVRGLSFRGSTFVRPARARRCGPTPARSTFGGFASDNYWSSSENDNNNAWNQNFGNGNQNNNNKDNNKRVRLVRVFEPAGRAVELSTALPPCLFFKTPHTP